MGSVLGPNVERAYWTALTSQAALVFKEQDSELATCSCTGCKQRSTEASSLAVHPTMGALPLCDGCVAEGTIAQAAIHERRNPEHTKWRAMLTKWLTENPKTTTKECWTCHDPAAAAALARGRQWCGRCDTLALSLLPEVSSGEYDVFSDVFADPYYDVLKVKIKAKLADVLVDA